MAVPQGIITDITQFKIYTVKFVCGSGNYVLFHSKLYYISSPVTWLHKGLV